MKIGAAPVSTCQHLSAQPAAARHGNRASSSKRPIESEELASLRASVAHLTHMMTEMIEREAKRQASANAPQFYGQY